VIDKGFVYVVPMKRKGEVLLAMKQLSKEVKTFCDEIGSTLRALEEGTPWANKTELYIGLLK
jgi:hypothetical protein